MAANPESIEWLEQNLHDVHLPPDVPWWPPAPGWWLLAFTSVVLMMWMAWRYRQQMFCSDPRRLALAKLDALQSEYRASECVHDYIRQCNIILRELAIVLAGRKQVAQLTGNAWIEWLEHGLSVPLPDEVRVLLGTACYQRTVTANIDELYIHMQKVIRECRASENRQASHA